MDTILRKKCEAAGVHGLPPPLHFGRREPQGDLGSPRG